MVRRKLHELTEEELAQVAGGSESEDLHVDPGDWIQVPSYESL